jgi:hypothetical protein
LSRKKSDSTFACWSSALEQISEELTKFFICNNSSSSMLIARLEDQQWWLSAIISFKLKREMLNESWICFTNARKLVYMKTTSLKARYKERDSAMKEERRYLYVIVDDFTSTKTSVKVTCDSFLDLLFHRSRFVLLRSTSTRTCRTLSRLHEQLRSKIHSCCYLTSILIDSILTHLCQQFTTNLFEKFTRHNFFAIRQRSKLNRFAADLLWIIKSTLYLHFVCRHLFI